MLRTIGRQGIKVFNDLYYCQEVGEAFAGAREVRVKYDPRDLSHIYLRIAGCGYVTVPLRLFREGPPPTLWLYKAARRIAGELDKTRPHREVLRRATAEAEQIIHDASRRSGKAARQLERLARDRRPRALG